MSDHVGVVAKPVLNLKSLDSYKTQHLGTRPRIGIRYESGKISQQSCRWVEPRFRYGFVDVSVSMNTPLAQPEVYVIVTLMLRSCKLLAVQ